MILLAQSLPLEVYFSIPMLTGGPVLPHAAQPIRGAGAIGINAALTGSRHRAHGRHGPPVSVQRPPLISTPAAAFRSPASWRSYGAPLRPVAWGRFTMNPRSIRIRRT